MTANKERKKNPRATEQLAKRWPGLRYLGLGIILSWIHVEADFVSQLAAVRSNRSIMTGNGIWLYLGMLIAYLAFALASRPAVKLFDRRRTRFLVLAICVVGAGLLVAASPGIDALVTHDSGTPGFAQIAFFVAGTALLGIVEGATFVQCARLYIPLKPSEMVFFTLISQLVVFFLYNILNSYSIYLVCPGGPSYSALLGVILLPFLAWCLMALPKTQPTTVETADAADTGSGAGADTEATTAGQADDLRSTPPSFPLLTLSLFIVVVVMSMTLNALMGIAPPANYLVDAQLAMLIRFFIVLALLAVCFVFAKRFPLDKFFRACTVIIAIAPALMLLVGISTPILVMVITDTLFLLDLLVWIILILAVRDAGEDAPRLFALGMAIICAGIILGSILGSIEATGTLLSENRISGACLTALILLLSVLLLNERRVLAAIRGGDENGLVISSILIKPASEPSPTQKARLWDQACQNVGERAMLSEREHELLRLLAVNRSSQDIADHLSISLHTVRTHTRNIYSKMGVHSRDELIAAVREERERLR